MAQWISRLHAWVRPIINAMPCGLVSKVHYAFLQLSRYSLWTAVGHRAPPNECLANHKAEKNNIPFFNLWRTCVVADFPLDFRVVFMVSIIMIRLRYIIDNYCHSFQTVLFSGLRNISLQILCTVGRVWNKGSRMLGQGYHHHRLLRSIWSYKISPLWGCLHWSGLLLFGGSWTSSVAHLNVCSIHNKVDELRVLQSICRFDITAITETQQDNSLCIDGMKLLRRDRTKCKGSGCIMYCAKYLQTTYRRDLASKDLEAMWVQIKFPTTSALFLVFTDWNLNVLISSRTYTAFLRRHGWNRILSFYLVTLIATFKVPIAKQDPKFNLKRLLTFFQLFGMQNVVNKPTKITLGSSTLIDLIVTTNPNLINRKGVVPLGLSDHCLIYATLNLKIDVQNYKQFQVDQLLADIIAQVFEDKGNVLSTWNKIIKDSCNLHALVKSGKIFSLDK